MQNKTKKQKKTKRKRNENQQKFRPITNLARCNNKHIIMRKKSLVLDQHLNVDRWQNILFWVNNLS